MENENLQTHHKLFAIRMHWLRWLATPIIILWNYIVCAWKYVVSAFCWAWGLYKLSWKGTKQSLNSTYWKVGTVSLGIGLYCSFFFVFIAQKLDIGALAIPGFILLALAFCWTLGAITGLIKYKKDNGSFPEGSVKPLLGNGMASVRFVLLSIGIVAVLALAIATLAFIGMIPQLGSVLLGIFSLPMVIAAAIIILVSLILITGFWFIAAHVLHNSSTDGSLLDNYKNTSRSLIKVIIKKFVDLFVIASPALILAFMVTILPTGYSISSAGLAFSITESVSDMVGYDMVTEVVVDNVKQNDCWEREGHFWSEKKCKTMAPGGPFWSLLSQYGFMGSTGYVIAMLTVCLLIGFVLSFAFAVLSSILYEVYTDSREASFFKKVIGGILVGFIPSIILGIVSPMLAMLFMFM